MKTKEKARIKEFKEYWYNTYSYISLELTDIEILKFVKDNKTLETAADQASDYLLSQGLAEVQE